MSRAMARYLFTEEINKIFGEIYEEVKRIRKITDAKQRAEEAQKARSKLSDKWLSKGIAIYQQYKEEGELGMWEDVEHGFCEITWKKYEGHNTPYQLLLNIWSEADAKAKRNTNQKTNFSPPPPLSFIIFK